MGRGGGVEGGKEEDWREEVCRDEGLARERRVNCRREVVE